MADETLTNRDAELALLGSLVIDPDAIVVISERVSAADFYDQRHRWIYEAVHELYEQRRDVDYVSICDRLEAHKRLKELGGSAYVVGLLNATPTSMHALEYADEVRKLGILRRLMASAGKIAALAYNGRSSELDDVLTKAQRLIDAVQPVMSDEAILLWLDSLERMLEAQVQRAQEADAAERGQALGPGSAPYLGLPWSALSRYNLRLRPGTLAIVAAGSGVGKTTFLECCAEHWARQGYRVAFYHLELAHQLMMDRRLARLTGLSLQQVEDGAMGSDRGSAAIDEAYKQLRSYSGGITYVHCPGWSASRIAGNCRQLHAKGLCDVAIVDYLQKLTLIYRQGQNKADNLGDAAETLKITGEQLGIPVVLASQFNRGIQHVNRKTGDYIRGSGEPHEKANLVITLDREILNAPNYDDYGKLIAGIGERSPVMKVRVDKNTGGGTGDTELIMNAARFLILDETRENTPITI